MTWFLLALAAPFLYALTNFIDKILLNKYFKEGGAGTLILVSAFLSIIILPIILLIDPSVIHVGLYNVFILSIVALLDVAILWFYLLALSDDEPSIIIVFYQLVPVMALILGYVLLGEVPTKIQIIAMGIIILGTTLISFKLDDENNLKLKKKTIIFMTLAAFCWASESVLFKYVALEENIWRSLFWQHLALVVIGFIIFFTIKSYRKHFLIALKSNSFPVISLNIINESIYIVGNTLVAFAILLAPVALVLLGESFQSFFVLLIGIFLTLFFPNIYKEEIERKYILQKLIAIGITGIGTFLLLSV